MLLLATPVLAEPPRLRVLSYNIHHGAGIDGKLDLPRIAAVIKAANADVVALQEVDRATRRTNTVDQTVELARLTGLHGRFVVARPYDGGEYGQAILSREPVGPVTVHQLTGKPGAENRVVGEVSVPASGGRPAFTFATTHLQHDDAKTRATQSGEVAKLFAGREVPVVLAGDLNAPRGGADLKPLAGWDFAVPPGTATFPAGKPRVGIDHVLTLPPGRFQVVEVKVIDEPVASDHRPLLVVLEWVGSP